MTASATRLTELLGLALCHRPCASADPLRQGEGEALFALAKRHDLAHALAYAIEKAELAVSPELLAKLERERMAAWLRYERSAYELTALTRTLSQAGIPHVPRKGAGIRDLYPEAYLRTGCDLDVLVHEEELERAAEALVTRLGYRRGERGPHDLSLHTPAGVHIELHFALMEAVKAGRMEAPLLSVWEHTREGEGQTLRLTDGMLYYYHLAHMAKHFASGGCGIRPFLDLWMLRHGGVNVAEAAPLLAEGGLETFAREAEALSEAWFGQGEATPVSSRMAEFVLAGGVYGTSATLVTFDKQGGKGRVGYALSRIFAPWDTMRDTYPVLRKHPYLLPFCYIKRMAKLFRKDTRRRARAQMEANATADTAARAEAEEMLRDLGLR